MSEAEMSKIYRHLNDLGFTEYEAKIYIALLQSSPENGNTIAKNSGVPPSKVYEALRKMQEKKMVFPVSGGENGNKKGYSPVPYDMLLSQKRKEFKEGLDFLGTALEQVAKRSNTEWTELFVIDGYTPSIETIRSSIETAETQILLSCWCHELELLSEALRSAFDRGVAIITQTFDVCRLEVPWKLYTHHQMELSLMRHSGELCLAIDEKKSIVFQFNDDQHAHAVISQHPSTVLTTVNYIRHDILLNKLVMEMESEINERYGSVNQTYISDL